MTLTKEMQHAIDVIRFKRRLTFKELERETGITAKTLVKIVNADLNDKNIRFSHTTIYKVSDYLAKQHVKMLGY